jgi:hypothetical protein
MKAAHGNSDRIVQSAQSAQSAQSTQSAHGNSLRIVQSAQSAHGNSVYRVHCTECTRQLRTRVQFWMHYSMKVAAIVITAAPMAVQTRCKLQSSSSLLYSRPFSLDAADISITAATLAMQTRGKLQPSSLPLHSRLCSLNGCCSHLHHHCCTQGCADSMQAATIDITAALKTAPFGFKLQSSSALLLNSRLCRPDANCSHLCS